MSKFSGSPKKKPKKKKEKKEIILIRRNGGSYLMGSMRLLIECTEYRQFGWRKIFFKYNMLSLFFLLKTKSLLSFLS